MSIVVPLFLVAGTVHVMMSLEPPQMSRKRLLGDFFMPFCVLRLRYLYKDGMVLRLKIQGDEADFSQREKT